MTEPEPNVDSGDRLELLADADRPGGWLLLIDRIRQSYVDLDAPTYLEFEYVRGLADIVDTLSGKPLTLVHVGGGGLTLPRYVAATCPGSRQIVFEPDEELIAFVRARLPLGKRSGIKLRPLGGREGIAQLVAASADVVVLDAFAGGRVPAELTTTEFFADVARVLDGRGPVLANIADGPPLNYSRRVVAAARSEFAEVMVIADPAVLRGRRFGNVLFAGAQRELPVAEVTRSAASAMFPLRVLAGEDLHRWAGHARPYTDADSSRSPEPPEETWRVVRY